MRPRVLAVPMLPRTCAFLPVKPRCRLTGTALAANETVRRTLGGPGNVVWPGCPVNRRLVVASNPEVTAATAPCPRRSRPSALFAAT
jgi:hypothetical protein